MNKTRFLDYLKSNNKIYISDHLIFEIKDPEQFYDTIVSDGYCMQVWNFVSNHIEQQLRDLTERIYNEHNHDIANTGLSYILK